jgi:uncharacterized membrane protein YeaQ/YmgE (transglycosylase-associated protein family)
MELLSLLIIGGVIGWLAGEITGRGMPGGVIGNIVAGIVGAWLGVLLFGPWGPRLAGVFIVPALLGSILFLLITSWFMRHTRR